MTKIIVIVQKKSSFKKILILKQVLEKEPNTDHIYDFSLAELNNSRKSTVLEISWS